MKDLEKITAFMLAFAAIALSACGNGGVEAESTPETVRTVETTVTAESETETQAETTVSEEVSENETEETADDTDYFHQVIPDNVITPEVFKGAPEVCDIDAVMASRREDMIKYGEPYPVETVYNEETESFDHTYGTAAEYAESHYGYSFDNASPVLSYVKDDFDLDGKDEYYLCMVEYLNTEREPYTDVEKNTTKQYDAASLFSVYYIEDDGGYQLSLGKLLDLSTPENPTEPYTVSEDKMLFEVLCGYECYARPQIIDYGDSRQLFWDQSISYPMDYGADLFWGSKHLRINYSEPNENLRGFCDYACIENGVTAEQEAKFYLNGGIPENADLNYLDENNYIVWNGSEYVHSCIAYDRESGASEFTVKDEVIPWDIRP